MSKENIVEVKVSSSLLLKELSALKSLIVANPVIPILSNFLFEITKNTLTISASDLFTSVIKKMLVAASGERKLAVPATILVETLRNLPDQEITIQLDSKGYNLVLLTANGRYQILCESAADFPIIAKVEEKTSTTINIKALKKALKKTLFAACKDEMKPNMCGVHISIDPAVMTFASTNGYRLVRYCIQSDFSIKIPGITLPSKSIQLLPQLLSEQETSVKMSIEDKRVHFSVGSLHIIISIIAEPFPAYEDAIPRTTPYKLTIATSSLQRTIRLMGCYADDTTHEVCLSLHKDSMEVQAEDLKLSNKGETKLPCNYEGEEMKIGVDAKLLLEMLNHMGTEEIVLHLSQPQKEIVITPSESEEDLLMLIMPILLRSAM